MDINKAAIMNTVDIQLDSLGTKYLMSMAAAITNQSTAKGKTMTYITVAARPKPSTALVIIRCSILDGTRGNPLRR
jgi:hypothetical protein